MHHPIIAQACSMDWFWIKCNTEDKVKEVTRIRLSKLTDCGGRVTWGENTRDNGQWQACRCDEIIYIIIEYAASYKAAWKRHIMRQIDPALYKLEPNDHAWYDKHQKYHAGGQIHDMWTKDGTYNQNKGNVYLKPFLVPKIVADIKELPAVMEPEERATDSKVVCGRIVKVVQPDVDLGR